MHQLERSSMTTADTDWVTFTKDAMSDITAKEEADKVDHVWADRISTLPVGHGFRARRDDSETVRQFKGRLNRAARFTHRELEWFPDHKNLKTEDETSWVVKVRSFNTKAAAEEEARKKAAAEAASNTNGQNASNPSQEGPETPSPETNGSS